MSKIILSAFADEAGNDLNTQIEALKDNGLHGLEIRMIDGKSITELEEPQIKEIKKRLDNAGIFTWSIGSPIGKIKLDDDFEGHLDTFKKCLLFADILEAKHLRMFSFFLDGKTHAEAKSPVFENLYKLVSAGKNSDVLLCHENEKGIYGNTADKCLEIHKEFPQIKAIFDPANYVQCGQDTKKAWEMISPYVEYMHIKDSKIDGTVVPAGEGDGNIPYLIKRYLENGGKEFTLEPHLAVFDGLSNLELEGNRSEVDNYSYGSNREAFKVAATALKNLLAEEL